MWEEYGCGPLKYFWQTSQNHRLSAVVDEASSFAYADLYGLYVDLSKMTHNNTLVIELGDSRLELIHGTKSKLLTQKSHFDSNVLNMKNLQTE